MVRYKVVYKKDRSSCSLSKLDEKYTKHYLENKIVKAKKKTMGIFCFKTKKQAEDFIGEKADDLIIIKVAPIGKGNSPKSVCGCPEIMMFAFTTDKILDIFYGGNGSLCWGEKLEIKPPQGTICYPAVRVLE